MQYQRMYETRSVRPYYTIPHLGVFSIPLKHLVGFEYKKTIYVTSPEMHNAAYFEVAEMGRATKFFARLWQNDKKVRNLIRYIRAGFREAKKVEAWAWKQNWSRKSTRELLRDAWKLYRLLVRVFGTMIVSQPQHVRPLEDTITKLLAPYPNRDTLLRAATYYHGDLPWRDEERTVKRLHTQWRNLSRKERSQALRTLVKRYAWFNAIEGDRPFYAAHYHKKILSFQEEKPYRPLRRSVPRSIRDVGHLIGELGYL